MRIHMVPHDPKWQRDFQQEAQQITDALGANAITVHHIGSTAIPTIYAKPVIDLLLVVQDLAALDTRQSLLEAMGYEELGEHGIPERRFFRRDNALGDRTHQIHAFKAGSPQIDRHFAFREYMIAHPDTAQEYSSLKRDLAAKHPNDIEAYMDGKDAFIQGIDRQTAEKALSQ